jgi:hypothetical protein
MEDAFEKNNMTKDGEAGHAASDLLATLLSNSDLTARVVAALGGIKGGEESATNPQEPAPKPEYTAASAPPAATMGDGIATLLQNPAVLERLPQMMAVLKPLMDSGTAKPQAAETAVSATPSPMHNREHLLLSLKPFLSKERCDAVDAILRISQLGDVLGKLK